MTTSGWYLQSLSFGACRHFYAKNNSLDIFLVLGSCISALRKLRLQLSFFNELCFVTADNGTLCVCVFYIMKNTLNCKTYLCRKVPNLECPFLKSGFNVQVIRQVYETCRPQCFCEGHVERTI